MKRILCLFLLMIIGTGMCGCEQEVFEREVDPVAQRKVLLKEAYEICCVGEYDFATLSPDSTCLVIDTNPKDEENYGYQEDACMLIRICNGYLEFPVSVTEKMFSTRSVDGMQSQNCGDFSVSWTYYPTCGLRVIYEINVF